MSGLAPIAPPSAQLHLVQSAERLRLAVKEIRGEFEHVEKSMKEVQNDLILVLSALQELQDESHNEVQP